MAERATNPDAAILYVGIGAFEAGRTVAVERGWAPWRIEFPMCRKPHLSRDDMLEWARSLGLRPPARYEPPYSLPHNNFLLDYATSDTPSKIITSLSTSPAASAPTSP